MHINPSAPPSSPLHSAKFPRLTSSALAYSPLEPIYHPTPDQFNHAIFRIQPVTRVANGGPFLVHASFPCALYQRAVSLFSRGTQEIVTPRRIVITRVDAPLSWHLSVFYTASTEDVYYNTFDSLSGTDFFLYLLLCTAFYLTLFAAGLLTGIFGLSMSPLLFLAHDRCMGT